LPLPYEADDVVAGEEAFVKYFDEELRECKRRLKYLRYIPILLLVCTETDTEKTSDAKRIV
jgi:hypothetical protein